MTLPILMSVPHAGLAIPPEVEELNLLTPGQIAEDGDEGSDQLYALEREVHAFVTTEIARAFVDMNRSPADRSSDGVVKTHTCWNVQIYRHSISTDTVKDLIDRYYRPYHQQLTAYAMENVKVGFDCHTMASTGPPVGPDPGMDRPAICISNGIGTCDREWLGKLALCLGREFGKEVAVNHPFKGGHIIHRHATELPWVQIEFSRASFMSMFEKRSRLLMAFTRWCDTLDR